MSTDARSQASVFTVVQPALLSGLIPGAGPVDVTTAIQDAIRTATAQGGGFIFVPASTYYLHNTKKE
jgi:polygalacturonase